MKSRVSLTSECFEGHTSSMLKVRVGCFGEKDDKGLLTCSPRRGIPEAGTSRGRKRALKKKKPKP